MNLFFCFTAPSFSTFSCDHKHIEKLFILLSILSVWVGCLHIYVCSLEVPFNFALVSKKNNSEIPTVPWSATLNFLLCYQSTAGMKLFLVVPTGSWRKNRYRNVIFLSLKLMKAQEHPRQEVSSHLFQTEPCTVGRTFISKSIPFICRYWLADLLDIILSSWQSFCLKLHIQNHVPV